jgi:small subunit ribosomal protein S20
MPIKKSAKKYMRVTARKTEKNRKIKGQFRSSMKAVKEALAKGENDKIMELAKRTQKALDKAAQKKIIHRNTAARKKSRLSKMIKQATMKK